MSLGKRFLSMFRTIPLAYRAGTSQLWELWVDSGHNLYTRVSALPSLSIDTSQMRQTMTITETNSATPNWSNYFSNQYFNGGVIIEPTNNINHVVFQWSNTHTFSDLTFEKILTLGGVGSKFILPYVGCDLGDINDTTIQIPRIIPLTRISPEIRDIYCSSCGDSASNNLSECSG